MKELFSISECAKFCGVSTRTLRYYDKLGIITPKVKDASSQYRFYGEEEIDRVHFVNVMKELGYSLERIKKEMDTMNSTRFLEIISEHRQRLEEDLVRVNYKLNRTKRLERNLNNALSHPIGKIFIDELTERRCLFVKLDSQDKFENQSFRHALESQYNISKLPGTVGRVVSRENLLRGKYIEYSGYLISEDSLPIGMTNLTLLPPSLAVACYCPVERSQSGPYWERMMLFIASNGYEIIGDGLKTVLIEKGIAADPDEYMSRLSIPVRKKE